MKILTLTLNPCVDRTLWVHDFGETPFRTDLQTGGKGVNVARVLGNLGADVTAVCPLGGETGRQFRELAASENIPLAWSEAACATRVIDTCVRESDYAQDVRYVRGGALTEAELDDLERVLLALLPGADCLAVCGSASCEAAAKRVPGLLRRAKAMDVKTLLDSNGPALLCGAEALPDLIKPNEDELFALTGVKDDPSRAAKLLLDKGVGGVLASLGSAGCMWAGPGFEEYCPAPKIAAVNPVGSGDSFVAGFLYASSQGYAPKAALMLACACGAANAAEFPAARVTREQVEALQGWKI